ncbi:hypothetical protein Dxin01_00825 [Deinococcus xinjiangensis]|uniref:Uncharacterized protein n=1 Tax=Deinococcus xinjiangensis TaxID=457454 RepID=A0ABP9V738_9DEIO
MTTSPHGWGEQLLSEDTEYVITHEFQRLSHKQRILIEPLEMQRLYAQARAATEQAVFQCLSTAHLPAGMSFREAVNRLSAAVPVQYHRVTHHLFVQPDAEILWSHE